MAKKDTEVGEHARQMRGADHGTAVSADHRVLEPTGAGGEIDAKAMVPVEQRDRCTKQQRLQEQGDAVAPPESERAILDQIPAEHGARNKGENASSYQVCAAPAAALRSSPVVRAVRR